MNKKSIYVYIAATLSMVIPAPGRFACGLILIVELNVLMLTGTLVKYLIKRIGLEQVGAILQLSVLISVTMLLRQLLAVTVPETAIQLGFVMYLPTVSSFLIGFMFGNDEGQLGSVLQRNMMRCLSYSAFALVFFLIREILGFGTVTVLTLGGIHEIVLFDSDRITALSFIATIPGALVCTAAVLIFHVFVYNKLTVIENAEQTND